MVSRSPKTSPKGPKNLEFREMPIFPDRARTL
jgi:hypothetical protein